MNIHSGLQDPAAGAGEQIERMLLARQNVKILLLLSGGSSFDVLEHVHDGLGGNVTVSMIDDRYSEDKEVNNFSQLLHNDFTKRCTESGCYIFGTHVNVRETMAEHEQRYERMLKDWIETNPEGKVIALMGIGADGHTAGILPFPESKKVFDNLFEQEGDFATAYDAKEKSEHSLRMTVTNDFLRKQVDYAVIYAVGEDKRKALEDTLTESGEVHITPARVIRQMKDVELFTDLTISY